MFSRVDTPATVEVHQPLLCFSEVPQFGRLRHVTLDPKTDLDPNRNCHVPDEKIPWPTYTAIIMQKNGLFWYFYNTVMILLWYYYDTIMILLWYHYDTIMILLWYFRRSQTMSREKCHLYRSTRLSVFPKRIREIKKSTIRWTNPMNYKYTTIFFSQKRTKTKFGRFGVAIIHKTHQATKKVLALS